MGRIGDTMAGEIADRLKAVPAGRQRAVIVQEYVELLGVSQQAIRKRVKELGVESGRRRRADFGSSRVPEDTFLRTAAFVHGGRTKKNNTLAAADAIDMARLSGVPFAHLLTPTMLNTWMQRNKVTRQDATRPTPHQELRTEYSNELHLVDTSVFAAFRLANTGKLVPQTVGFDAGYKNKPGEGPTITRYVLNDHCSHAFFVWYFPRAENQRDLIHFLHLAWAGRWHMRETEPKVYQLALRRAEKRIAIQTEPLDGPAIVTGDIQDECPLSRLYPFRGIPEMLYTDAGPAFGSVTKAVLRNLNVRHLQPTPGNPRPRGSNERLHKIWEDAFEMRLQYERISTIEELNAVALDFCVWYNAEREMRRHKRTRRSAWVEFLHGREVLEMLPYTHYRTLAVLPSETREVAGDGSFSYPVPAPLRKAFNATSFRYRIRDTNARNFPIEVRPNLYDYPTLEVYSPRTGLTYPCEPVNLDEHGFAHDGARVGKEFKSPAHTTTQKNLANLSTIAPTGGEKLIRKEKPSGATPADIAAHKRVLAEKEALERATNVVDSIAITPKEGYHEALATTQRPQAEHPSAPSGVASAPPVVIEPPAITAPTPARVHGKEFQLPQSEERHGPIGSFKAKKVICETLFIQRLDELPPHQEQFVMQQIHEGITLPEAKAIAAAVSSSNTPLTPAEGVSL